MRLSLRQIAGPQSGKNFPHYLEHGRMTIGRAADCTLQLEDPQRVVSKHHCAIERTFEGFRLCDESSVGTSVDGVMLHDGETAELSSGSVISLCGFEFRVGISGEGAPDMTDPGDNLRLSDEIPTISSILADVAPGGHMASGMLPGGGSIDFLDIGPSPAGVLSSRDATIDRIVGERDAEAGDVPSSRNVTIGWEGPPKIEKTDNVGLPADWNDPSSLSNELEHRIAINTVIQVKSRDKIYNESNEAPPQEHQAGVATQHAGIDEARDATAAFRKHRLITIVENELPEPLRDAVPEPVRDAVPEPVRDAIPEPVRDAVPEPVRDAIPEPVRDAVPEPATVGVAGNVDIDMDDLLLSRDESSPLLEQRVRLLEDLLSDLLAKYETEISPANNNVMYAGQRADAAAIASRLDVLSERQTRLYSAIDHLLERLRSMEPPAIEARVALGEARLGGIKMPAWILRLPLLAESAYWRCFKSNFQRGSKASMLEFFREALRNEFDLEASQKTSIESEESKINEG